MRHPLPRRAFLEQLGLLAIVPLVDTRGPGHPDPRPGIDASHIVPDATLPEDADVRAVFAKAREIPQILDGIRCHCGCAVLPGHRSLLTCFEGDAMAQECRVCQGQTTLAYDLFKRGRTLGVIRMNIDRKFG